MTAALKVKEVADILQVSLQSVYKEINEGRLKAFRIGRALRISAKALDDFQNGGCDGISDTQHSTGG